ncbi:OmpA family protein [Cryomorphaceae bacterium 1068]|nr:OmpA family protein [Cryomorphaceae bacterium 1068]
MINRFHSEPLSDVPENYVLSGFKEQTIIINEYELASNTKQSLLNQMISYGLKSFVDDNYFVENGQIRVYSSALDFDESASALVKNAIWINDLPFSELFQGFSDDVLSQASHLKELNGRRLSDPLDQDDLSLYGFQSLVFSLKESAMAEATEFIEEYMSIDESQEDDNKIRVMPAEEFQLMADPAIHDNLGDLSLNPDLFASNRRPSKKNRRKKNDFSEEVVTLLEENNRILSNYSEMFQNLQSQIDEINRRDNSDLREDMAEMRQMITELKDEPSRSSTESGPEYLIFAKNEYELSEVQKARLNKTIVLLVKNPSQKALVTGYADRSGDSEYNAWISQQRAESVRVFLESMGIEGNRVVVTYLGDTESTTSGPADRRVEVNLIN